MDLAKLIPLALKGSIFLNVFLLGVDARPGDLIHLLRSPGKLLRSLLSMNILMPLLVVVGVAIFKLHPAVEIALLTLAISPIPPLLPQKTLKAGGEASYAFGLLTVAALLAILFVPVGVAVYGKLFGRPTLMSPLAVMGLVVTTVLAPLAAGMLVRRVASGFAERISKPVSLVAKVLLVASVVPILFVAWPAIVSLIGNGTILAIAVFLVVGLAAGYLIGGPDPEDRVVLSFATAFRHPGVAIAIATANFPGQKPIPAAILLYLLLGAVVSVPIVAWRKKQRTRVA
jgi:bile acid:Na+ symporter, BASS family